jgi:hypothetical protein
MQPSRRQRKLEVVATELGKEQRSRQKSLKELNKRMQEQYLLLFGQLRN